MNSTSSFNDTIVIANPPSKQTNDGQENTNFELNGLTTKDDDVFTIYEFKERRSISEPIDWHISSDIRIQTFTVADMIRT